MRPVLLEIGRLKIYSFGTFIALGAVLAGLLMYWMSRRRKIATKYLFDNILYTVISGLLAARLVYYFAYQNQFRSFWQAIYFWQGGLVALGGLVVGFGVYYYLLRKQKLPIWASLDIASLGLLVGWAAGKFGCHLSVCTVGRETTSSLALAGGYPVDLISSLWAAALVVAMFIVWLGKRFNDGVVFFLSLEGLFLGELLIKTLRADFGEGLIRLETGIYLFLIIVIYLGFWTLHGPGWKMNTSGLTKLTADWRQKLNRRRN